MVRVTSIRNIAEQQFDETWLIVRSLKHPVKNAIQIQALSPSLNLFFKYQRLAKDGRWGEKAFHEIYVPDFIYGLLDNPIAIAALNDLHAKSKAGKNICIACFCPNEAMCHRSIIAGMLQGTGVDVVTDSGDDYTHYWQQYSDIVKARKAASR